jgi:O-acetyl-ADP-ribose deacetylase
MNDAYRSTVAGGKVIELVEGDITQQDTDAIVNAANSGLLGGGGVDGAIHRAGGPAILEECRKIRDRQGPLPSGKAVVTTGGRLKATHVIHTVGPVYRDGKHGEAAVLADCYRNCVQLADTLKLNSVAFPSISTGAYGYPMAEAASVALWSVTESLDAAQHVKLVRFVLWGADAYNIYLQAARDKAAGQKR